MTTLKELEKRHNEAVSTKIRRMVNNYHWQINENDKKDQFHEDIMKKELGRSARVYKKLMGLDNKK